MPSHKILGVPVAWEVVHKSRYILETGKFVPIKSKSESRKSSGHDGDWKTSIPELESKMGEPEKAIAKAENTKSWKSGKITWLAKPLKKETLDDFRASTSRLAAWMLEGERWRTGHLF